MTKTKNENMLRTEPMLFFRVKNAHCASCVTKIENSVSPLPGVSSATLNFADRTLTISGDVAVENVIDTVQSAGYDIEVIENESDDYGLQLDDGNESPEFRKKLWQSLAALGFGTLLMIFGMSIGDMHISDVEEQLSWFFLGLLTLIVLAYTGKSFYRGAVASVKQASANMDTLIALGTGVAWLYSMVVVILPTIFPDAARYVYFEASLMIVGFVGLGQTLELRSRKHTSAAIKRLIELKPKIAHLLENGIERDVSIEVVDKGNHLRIRPGESVPVDGVVIRGETFIDESMLTGESVSIKKFEGEEVFAGTLNKNGSIEITATKVGRHTTLARIISLIKQAQNTKPKIAKFVDRVASIFVPVVILIAFISALVWLVLGPAPRISYAMVVFCSVLIIACPCALGLATPISLVIGIGRAAEKGLLIRNGEALERTAHISTVVLDKTGTITAGEPGITNIDVVSPNSEEDILRLAASIEQYSEHPYAIAILKTAKERKITLSSCKQFSALPGLGVIGMIKDQVIMLGNQRLMEKQKVDLNIAQIDISGQTKNNDKTILYLARANKLLAMLTVEDPVKLDSKAALVKLQRLNIRTIMMTGDAVATAKKVAAEVGISEFHAEVMPEQKLAKIEELQANGEVVAMIGDGINDAPALMQADVGFAIGTGTDVALESADISLIRDSLLAVVDTILLSKQTLKNIKQNLFGAFFYNLASIPIAAGVLYPLTGLLFNPMIAGAAMALSSLTVVTNATRLRTMPLD